jgi:deazaflavin-dependent oxidoreductase (nitroreductase family)
MSDETPSQEEVAAATNDWNKTIIDEFRANGGKVGGPFEGAPLLLLHTKGARTQSTRINPVVFLETEDRMFVFASKAGADTSPDWYYNLIAHPSIAIEIGSETYDVTATPLAGAERDRIYTIQAERLANFAEYQAKTDRIIPVVELVAN